MKPCYAARKKFDRIHAESLTAWESYLSWSRIFHLKELVTVDMNLCENIVEPNFENQEDLKQIIFENEHETGFYQDLDYVLLRKMDLKNFNLLKVIIEPSNLPECKNNHPWIFLGYDLIDKSTDTSALTNSGEYYDWFFPKDLNDFGLISAFEKAFSIKHNLIKRKSGGSQSDFCVFEIWRHKYIGNT